MLNSSATASLMGNTVLEPATATSPVSCADEACVAWAGAGVVVCARGAGVGSSLPPQASANARSEMASAPTRVGSVKPANLCRIVLMGYPVPPLAVMPAASGSPGAGERVNCRKGSVLASTGREREINVRLRGGYALGLLRPCLRRIRRCGKFASRTSRQSKPIQAFLTADRTPV